MKSQLPEGIKLPEGTRQGDDRALCIVPGHIVVSVRVNGDTLLEVAVCEEAFDSAMQAALGLAADFGRTLEPPLGALDLSSLTLLEAYERGVDQEDEAEKAQIAISAMVLIDHGSEASKFLAQGARHLALDLKSGNGKGFHLVVSAGWPAEDGPH
ncbi:hypothetical protein TSH7_09795 [Azospirillum sp. TSH7]|uniref:hypothetical protein n=1 Tax=unclassified Azospirillum TaxID=2630922 RepID=UPI000D621F2A|nr:MULTISPECIES: hypothetical protein [unclassified Azospirillum]PWC63964.1 hypothetical protein TSH20_18890 [Azospirillum sp. TSH20]PWC64827.1 hypothetical protein TSH7_09795 [Azospirillum sp. TSH7]